ncbi:hypothetical protein [Mucilaginibacter sp. BT774]|uniref:hypothetical protein n=1 Tax=Mucilaginibacter sp. BT774 TaxID=3062276 RepID=UPI00267600D6|nr:hypothetical protein [Mucilaginibacter sp. BT774]MDO3628239.1 hypothetical protein [Mucilaginibacter sp. BT774]
MQKKALYFGFLTALTAFIAASGYGVVQLLQLFHVTTYPLDEILIYAFSLLISLPFLLSILALHYTTPQEKRLWSHAAVLMALMYTTYVILMYSVQLATVIPDSFHNKMPTILTVTPHSFFWTLDALGYICMGISTLFAYFALEKSRANRWLRTFMLANALTVPLISVAYFYPNYSIIVLLIGSPWIITAPGSMLSLAFYFRKRKLMGSN